jgi:leucyl-tRNA synthetase
MKEGDVSNAKDIVAYQDGTRLKSELQRQENKEKTGVEIKGVTAKNPATGEMIPVWIADYVLGGYGTGAIMAVPAHDERDFEFAKVFGLPVKQVVSGVMDDGAMTEEGVAMDSGILDGLNTADAKKKMIEWLEANEAGERKTTYRLRDWVFSRQRYWGEPIPIVICKDCGYVPVPSTELPVVLPEVEHYEPTDTGESPLADIEEWVVTTCPNCGKPATRETDTMPNWAGSSWYFLRYCDPHNDKEFASQDAMKFWMPVDLYNGGMEHTTLHLLYSRFWYKFLWDLDLVPRECGAEPYKVRRSHGMILGEGGIKMSKSKGNVVNPDDVVAAYGADVFRIYEMFMGPFDQAVPWDTNGIEGVKRFLEKVWRMYDVGAPLAGALVGMPKGQAQGQPLPETTETLLHRTIKKVGEDIESMNFNTAVSAMMILVNELSAGSLDRATAESFLKILAPFAPHMTEELWHELGNTTSIHVSGWPAYDASKLQASTFELVVQVNGKVRDKMMVASDISEKDATALALASEKIQAAFGGKMPQKIVYVKGRILSIST